VEESEGDKGETSGSKLVVTGEDESWIGKGGYMEEDIGDTGSYLEGKRNLSSNMGEEI